MNKRMSFIIVTLLVIALIPLCMYEFVFRPRKLANKASIDTVKETVEYYKKFGKTYGNEGVVKVSANYRGAHGESLPHDFTYNFLYEDGKLFIGNEDGYSSLDTNIIDVFNFISKLDLTFNKKNNQYSFDATNISKLFDNNSTEGLVMLTDSLTITILNSDTKVTFDKEMKQGKGKLFGKNITITKNSKGLSLQYDNKVKINIFNKEDHIEYNIVNGDYTYKLYLYDNKIDISANGDSAVYRGLDMHFEFKDIDFNKNKELDKKDICITRYFNALGKVGSEY